MVAKLGDLNDRFEEVSALLSDAETMADREKFTALSKEFAEICFSEEPGCVYGPIVTDKSMHLLYLHSC